MRDEKGQSERSINGERIVVGQLFVPKKRGPVLDRARRASSRCDCVIYHSRW